MLQWHSIIKCHCLFQRFIKLHRGAMPAPATSVQIVLQWLIKRIPLWEDHSGYIRTQSVSSKPLFQQSGFSLLLDRNQVELHNTLLFERRTEEEGRLALNNISQNYCYNQETDYHKILNKNVISYLHCFSN